MSKLTQLNEDTSSNIDSIFYTIDNAQTSEFKVERQNIFQQDLSTTSSPTFDSMTANTSLTAPELSGGSYTPTVTSIQGITSVTSTVLSYFRILDTVCITGVLIIESNGSALPQLRFSLPISATFSATTDVYGFTGLNDDSNGLLSSTATSIYADTTNNEVRCDLLNSTPSSSTTLQILIDASYRI